MRWNIHRYEALGSTNQEALQRIRKGEASASDVIVARSQTAGRGRHGREWRSEVGGLWMTVVLPARVPLPGSGLATAAALCRTVARWGAEPRLKWPNDVEVRGRKLAGILVEHVAGRPLLAVGIGVNVMNSVEDLTQLRRPAISLARALDRPITPEALLGPLLDEIAALWHAWQRLGWPEVLSEVRRWDSSTGLPVRGTNEPWQGTALGLDDDGALLVRIDTGVVRRVDAGEIEFL